MSNTTRDRRGERVIAALAAAIGIAAACNAAAAATTNEEPTAMNTSQALTQRQ